LVDKIRFGCILFANSLLLFLGLRTQINVFVLAVQNLVLRSDYRKTETAVKYTTATVDIILLINGLVIRFAGLSMQNFV